MKIHNIDLYNILLNLSRNVFFYKRIMLSDNFETRIYLMFFHFSIILLIFKKKNIKFDQNLYDNLFNKIEYNIRELGYGDVAVNKKMKNLNKILYDILLKIELENNEGMFLINKDLVFKYFDHLNLNNGVKFSEFKLYFTNFYNYCFEKKLDCMLKELINFKFI